MADEKTQKLLQGGIAAAKKGDNELAKRAFSQVIKLDPNNEGAWLGLATVTEETDAKIRILNKILTINPDNARAKEALKRLGISDEVEETDEPQSEEAEVVEEIIEEEQDDDVPQPKVDTESLAAAWGVTPQNEAVEDPWGLKAEDEPEALAEDDDDIGLPPLEILPSSADLEGKEATAEEAAPRKPISRIRRLGEPAPDPDAPAEMDFGAPITSDAPSSDTRDGKRIFVVKRSADVFAAAPNALGGLNGIPIPPQGIIDRISEDAKASVQDYLERSLDEYEGYTFEKKERQKAGQNEWTQFLLVSGLSTLVTVGLLVTGLTFAILNNPTAVKVLFAPTWTPSVTPTASHTPTPGATNTASPTPRNTSTPVPTIRPTITPGNDVVNFPPRPTEFYDGPYTVDDVIVEQAVELLEQDNLNEAFEFLQAERQAAINSGDFLPTYFLVRLFVQQQQYEEAREAIADYEETVFEANQQQYESLINISRARINIAEAEGGAGGDLLTEAEELLERVVRLPDDPSNAVRLDPNNPEGYILLSEVYRLQNRPDDAVEVLEDIINNFDPDRGDLYAHEELRFALAQLYRSQGRYDDALVILDQLLTINPFNEAALVEQVEIAFEAGEIGLAVLFSEEYLYYYPGSVQGYLYLGRARRDENKLNLALNAFTRGLGGDGRDPAYAEILRERAQIYRALGRNAEAEEDLSLAADLGGETPQAIFLSVQSAFSTGAYSLSQLESDIEGLRGTGVASNSELSFILGQAQVDNGEYSDAVRTLERAIDEGLRAADRPLANELIAFAEFQNGDFDDALDAIEEALEDGDTIARRFLRGQIREELAGNDEEERLAALADYEFALLWGSLYGVDNLEDIQDAYNSLATRVGRVTS